jgi:hypothetical protein
MNGKIHNQMNITLNLCKSFIEKSENTPGHGDSPW